MRHKILLIAACTGSTSIILFSYCCSVEYLICTDLVPHLHYVVHIFLATQTSCLYCHVRMVKNLVDPGDDARFTQRLKEVVQTLSRAVFICYLLSLSHNLLGTLAMHTQVKSVKLAFCLASLRKKPCSREQNYTAWCFLETETRCFRKHAPCSPCQALYTQTPKPSTGLRLVHTCKRKRREFCRFVAR